MSGDRTGTLERQSLCEDIALEGFASCVCIRADSGLEFGGAATANWGIEMSALVCSARD
jgi:hypothetical protein